MSIDDPWKKFKIDFFVDFAKEMNNTLLECVGEDAGQEYHDSFEKQLELLQKHYKGLIPKSEFSKGITQIQEENEALQKQLDEFPELQDAKERIKVYEDLQNGGYDESEIKALKRAGLVVKTEIKNYIKNGKFDPQTKGLLEKEGLASALQICLQQNNVQRQSNKPTPAPLGCGTCRGKKKDKQNTTIVSFDGAEGSYSIDEDDTRFCHGLEVEYEKVLDTLIPDWENPTGKMISQAMLWTQNSNEFPVLILIRFPDHFPTKLDYNEKTKTLEVGFKKAFVGRFKIFKITDVTALQAADLKRFMKSL